MTRTQRALVAVGPAVAWLAFLIIVVVVAFLHHPHKPNPHSQKVESHAEKVSDQGEPEEIKIQSNPVIKGGVKSLEELLDIIKNNADIREHYLEAGFDATCATETTIEHSTWAYVSYRRGKSFQTSKRPILLLEGERVARDCHGTTVLFRCGNIAVFDKAPEMPAEFALNSPLPDFPLDIPEAQYSPLIEAQPSLPGAPTAPTTQDFPPYAPPFGVFCCLEGGSPSVPVTTPEVDGLWYMVTGIGALLAHQAMQGRKTS
jgi:hypothetical protein